MTHYLAIIICSTLLGFCLSLIVLSLLTRSKDQTSSGTKRRIRKLQRKVDRALHQVDNGVGKGSFNEELKAASLTTDLQVPRLQSMARIHQPPPEKYTILKKLISQGLAIEEIASILNISRNEASQLMTLYSMTRHRPPRPGMNHP